MQQDKLDRRLHAYSQWRAKLVKTIENFQAWLEQHDLASPEQELRIFEAIEALHKDRLTIAFVAEFSRGKTELINALFFAHYGRRLLPSEAGRTTMCPTELFYDHDQQHSYVRLLPIETRLQDRTPPMPNRSARLSTRSSKQSRYLLSVQLSSASTTRPMTPISGHTAKRLLRWKFPSGATP